MPADPANSPSTHPDRYVRLRNGFVYASRRLQTTATQRPSAVLLLSACGRPFELKVAGRSLHLHAAAVRPLVMRSLVARDCWLVSLNVHPTDDAYLRFLSIAGDGVLPLPPAAFDAQAEGLQGLFGATEPCVRATAQLTQLLLEALWPLLPPGPPPDGLRGALLPWLLKHPNSTLAEVAEGLGVPYHRLSRRFARAMGLSFRQWCAFARTQRAALHLKQDTTLTGIAHEVGFTDSAHLSRTWRKAYGLSPSWVRRDNSVQAIW
jgi:AraC family transcriptional regulator of arabinose operon